MKNKSNRIVCKAKTQFVNCLSYTHAVSYYFLLILYIQYIYNLNLCYSSTSSNRHNILLRYSMLKDQR